VTKNSYHRQENKRFALHSSVCQQLTSCKNYQLGIHENFTVDVSVNKIEQLKFCKSSTTGSWKTCKVQQLRHL